MKKKWEKFLKLRQSGNLGKRRSKYLRPTRKKIPNLLERVRDHIIHLRDHGYEEAKKNRKHFFGMITKEKLAKHFGVKEGEIQHCLQLLNQEGLISQAEKSDRYEGWVPDVYRIYNCIRVEEETKEIVPLFDFENCPICDAELRGNEKFVSMYHYRSCENKCFTHYLTPDGNTAKIFDELFEFNEVQSKGLADQTKNAMNKKIKFWKKNYRYLFKLMED